MNGIEKRMLLLNLVWIGIGLAISFAISITMYSILGDAAFPWNILVLVVVFIIIQMALVRRALRRGVSPGSGLFSNFGGSGIKKYRCYQCGTVYKGSNCPRCRARGGSVVFE